MNFAEINRVSKLEYLPTKRLQDLEIEKKYKISGVKEKNTRFGNKIYLEIEEEFGVFLPPRVPTFILETQDYLTNLCKEVREKDVYFKYYGERIGKIEFSYD